MENGILMRHILSLFVLLNTVGCTTTWRPCQDGGDVTWDPPIKGNRQCAQWKDKTGNFVNHGQFLQYDESGRLVVEGDFREGKRSGAWTEYDKEGKKSRQKWYYKGVELPGPIPRGVKPDEYLDAFLKQKQTITAPEFTFKTIPTATPPPSTQVPDPANPPPTSPKPAPEATVPPKPGPQI